MPSSPSRLLALPIAAVLLAGISAWLWFTVPSRSVPAAKELNRIVLVLVSNHQDALAANGSQRDLPSDPALEKALSITSTVITGRV